MEVFKNISWSITAKLFITISGFFVYGILGRYLSVDDFGLFNYILSIIIPSIGIMAFGMGLVSSKLQLEDNAKHVSMLITTFFVVSFLFLILTFPLNGYFDFFNRKIYYIVFSIAFFSSLLRILSDYFRSKNKFHIFAIYNSISTGGGIIVWTVFLISILLLVNLNQLSVDNIFYALLTATTTSAFLIIINFIKILGDDFKKISFKGIFSDEYSKFLFVCLSLTIITFFRTIDQNIFIWITNYQLSYESVAYIAIVLKIATLVEIPLSVIDVSTPQIISRKLKKSDTTGLENFIRKISLFRFSVGGFIMISSIILSEQIINIIFGIEYIHLSNYTNIILLSYMLRILLGPNSQILIIGDNHKQIIYLRIALLILISILTICFKMTFDNIILMLFFYRIIFDLSCYLLVKNKIKINTLPYIGF